MSDCLHNQLIHLNRHSFKIHSLFQGELASHLKPRSHCGVDVTLLQENSLGFDGLAQNFGLQREGRRECVVFPTSEGKTESICSTGGSKMCLSSFSGSSHSVISGQRNCFSTGLSLPSSTSLLLPCFEDAKGECGSFLPIPVRNI